MSPIDFRTTSLRIGQNRVTQLRVVGLAAEAFWRKAFHERKGMNALVSGDVTTVELRKVFVGNRKHEKLNVALSRDDAQLALGAARAVCDLIERNGFRILDAVVPQRIGQGRIVGEHDLVCERREGFGGRSSFEIKFRRVLNDRSLPLVRSQLREEAWRMCGHGNGLGRGFVERVCLLLRWGPGASDPFALGSWSASFAEARVVEGGADWKVLWGWPREIPASQKQSRTTTQATTTKAAAMVRMKAKTAMETAFGRHYRNCRKVSGGSFLDSTFCPPFPALLFFLL